MTKLLTVASMRGVAHSAARSQARKMGIDPHTLGPYSALTILDDIARSEPELLCSQWYTNAGTQQVDIFVREWNKALRQAGY